MATSHQLEAPLVALVKLVLEPALLVDATGALLWANDLARSLDVSPVGLAQLAAQSVQCEQVPSLVRQIVFGTRVHLVLLRSQAGSLLDAKIVRLGAAHGLTVAQRAVLARLVQGRSNKEIAADLGCAPKTVAVHVSNLLSRTGQASRQALTASFWQQPDEPSSSHDVHDSLAAPSAR